MTFTYTTTRDDGETEIEITYRVTSWGRPAKISGPPENCYPDEPAEVEIDAIRLLGTQTEIKLTDAEMERIEDEIYDNLPEDDGPDADYLYDRICDDRMTGGDL